MQELEEMADFKTYFDSTRRLAKLAEENGIEAPSKHFRAKRCLQEKASCH